MFRAFQVKEDCLSEQPAFLQGNNELHCDSIIMYVNFFLTKTKPMIYLYKPALGL